MSQAELHESASHETNGQNSIDRLRKDVEVGNSQQIMVSTRMTIGELMSLHLPDPNWLVPGMISIGLTNLSGRPKVGKSNLCLQLATAKATGGYFLGRKLEKGRVLYIDLENSQIRMQKRARKMRIPTNADLSIVFSWLPLDKGGLEELDEEIVKGKWDLIIIDTLSRALSIKADQLDMSPMNDIIGRLQSLAMSNNMNIIVIDHHRKGNGFSSDPVDDILGSTGKSAPLDTILGLYREKRGGTFTLRIVGRDIGDQEINLLWNPETFIWSIRDETQIQNHSRKDRVFEAMHELLDIDELPTTTNIAKHTYLDKSNVSSDITELLAERKVIAGEKQGREKPYYPVDRQPAKAITAD
jgi:RecA-family ATPase